MLPSFMNKPFVRQRFPLVSDHGAQVRDYTASPATATFRGSVQPGTGSEDLVNRDGAEIVKTIWATNPAADIQRYDLIVYAGTTYLVEGEPERWDTGVLDHLVVHLSAWNG